MNKLNLTIIALSALCLAAIASCKKNSSTPVTPDLPLTSAQELAGTWAITAKYVDSSDDNIMQSNELVQDTSLAHQFFKFSPNGTFTYSYYNTACTGSWQLLHSNGILGITDSCLYAPTAYGFVLLLDNGNMEIKDTINAAHSGITWTFYTKQ